MKKFQHSNSNYHFEDFLFPPKNIAGIFQEDRNKEDTPYSVYYNSTIIRALENKLVSLEATLIRNSARPPTHHTMGFAL